MAGLGGHLGATVEADGTRFSVFAPDATALTLCLFDGADREDVRIPMERTPDGIWTAVVPGIGAGQRYGYRAGGPFDPGMGFWFDPAKLLVDPFATRIGHPFRHDPALAALRGEGPDTAALVPKAVVEARMEASLPPPRLFRDGGLIYEVNARGLTMLHPDIAESDRGTLRALAHPAMVAHFKALGIDAVELMPIAAWIDERHLPPLGLSNAWGYNPVTLMAPDPRLAPGGMADLAHLTATLRADGIAVILDLVFNHTGESDVHGPVLSLRGLANNQSYRHDTDYELVNDTGTGNTLDCASPFVIRLVLDSLRYYVLAGGVDGFRFDLATVLGRNEKGFSPDAPLLTAIRNDPVLRDRVLIAEPWDIGPGGYRLGQFPQPFLEWNDRYRDTIRRFWRGDPGMLGALASALAGSSAIFAGSAARSVNFIAAHDGFTLADLTAYARKHNEANGENNRDGHGENLSWNHGVEGPTEDPDVNAARDADRRALLTLLFASRGTIMLTAGDESGRTQHGNNNAYCQDNADFWFDWAARDRALEAHAALLAEIRREWPHLAGPDFLTGTPKDGWNHPDVAWLTPQGRDMTPSDWEAPEGGAIAMLLAHPDVPDGPRLAILVNRHTETTRFRLDDGSHWRDLVTGTANGADIACPPRSVLILGEVTRRAG
ncbi:MAG: glycogen debranching protein GlgX [Brucellaceae bacterium]|nr:glycogen debranching protein GlgX [Brucellaceae bacterium]